MATPLVIPNAALIKLFWAQGTRSWLNVFGAVGTGALPPINQALADALLTGVQGELSGSTLISHLAATTLFMGVSIKDISAPNRGEFLGESSGTPGTGVTDPLPLSNAICITLRTALAGKSFRGRVYYSGFTEDANDASGRATAAAGGAARSFTSGLNGVLTGSGLQMAVLSRPAAAVTIPAKTTAARAGQATAVIQWDSRNTKWESQRRRTGRD